MAQGVPQFFTGISNKIQSYDWVDLSEGTGYVTVYGAKTSVGYVLIKNTLSSDDVETTGGLDANETPAKQDIDFDLKLNSPRNVDGKLLVEVPAVASGGSTGAPTKKIYIKVFFRKWDGTTETAIANATSGTLTNSGSSGEVWDHEKKFLVEVTIPNTHFKKGETIRVTIEAYAWQTGGGTLGNYGIGHDPQDRASIVTPIMLASGNTKMVVNIPFKINN